jgi:hypothetical protein
LDRIRYNIDGLKCTDVDDRYYVQIFRNGIIEIRDIIYIHAPFENTLDEYSILGVLDRFDLSFDLLRFFDRSHPYCFLITLRGMKDYGFTTNPSMKFDRDIIFLPPFVWMPGGTHHSEIVSNIGDIIYQAAGHKGVPFGKRIW